MMYKSPKVLGTPQLFSNYIFYSACTRPNFKMDNFIIFVIDILFVNFYTI